MIAWFDGGTEKRQVTLNQVCVTCRRRTTLELRARGGRKYDQTVARLREAAAKAETVGIIRAGAADTDAGNLQIYSTLRRKTVRAPIIVFCVVSDDLIAYIHPLCA